MGRVRVSHAFLTLITLGACSEHLVPDASSASATGAFAGFDTCNCTIIAGDLSFDCNGGRDLVSVTVPATDAPFRQDVIFIDDDPDAVLTASRAGNGTGVFLLESTLYPDPRGGAFNSMFQHFYIEKLVLPDQQVCDVFHSSDPTACKHFERSTIVDGRIYCEVTR